MARIINIISAVIVAACGIAAVAMVALSPADPGVRDLADPLPTTEAVWVCQVADDTIRYCAPDSTGLVQPTSHGWVKDVCTDAWVQVNYSIMNATVGEIRAECAR